MVKHIVLFSVKANEDKDRAARIAAEALEPLVGQIDGLVSCSVHRCFNGVDFALCTELESREALANYAVHPLHQQAKDKFWDLLDGRVAADYDFEV